ncbi:uncharacterized protein LOC123661186 [Melitaea cinxia]|uniref:uncharacterized protein LOC123661186 n=1 Tax=Melitaea cinxia TaxID=113334 RepID=UPI001E2732F0|nr:uncharacterized protein LOC123661186 [Melitaea cinxia]
MTKYDKCKKRQILKFDKLNSKSNVINNKSNTTDNDSSRAVVNLSKCHLDVNTIKVLEKGLNFAVTPRKIPFEEIICNVEDCLSKNNIKKEDSEAIRQDISSALRRSSVPKLNLPREQLKALLNLRNRRELTVLRADKGNATVVMDTSDYNDKIQQLLSDESTYTNIKADPTNKVLKITTNLIKKYSESLNLDVKSLIPSCPKPPKLYGLPKIHKADAPLRPIVSQIDSPTYRLAKHVAHVLSPLRGQTRAHTRDSYHFVNEIKHLHLSNNETMVSFDVQSLFTCLPVEDCISIVSRKLKENDMPIEYADLLKHCLTSGYMLWNNQFYKQVDGVAMGSPVSPVVADIFMEDFEETALRTSPITPRFYKRRAERCNPEAEQSYLQLLLILTHF